MILPLRLAVLSSIVATLLLIYHLVIPSQLELEDALYLTKNTLKQLRIPHFCKHHENRSRDHAEYSNELESNPVDHMTRSSLSASDSVIDILRPSVMRSVFPVDLLMSFNTSNETKEFVGRYASFSPILGTPIHGNYKFVTGLACSPLSPDEKLNDKILIVLRGNCSFVDKVKNLLDSNLNPRAIIVADDKPYHSLITMYSNTFNRDGLLTVPVLFITNEDYIQLYSYELQDPILCIKTLSIDNWLSLLMLIAISPTVSIIVFYLCIRGFQLCHRQILNSVNEKLVKTLSVYIFNQDHLIPVLKFPEYLGATGQTCDMTQILSSSEDLPAGQEIELQQPRNEIWINGVDIRLFKNWGLLFASQDYYLTFKCAICLDRFMPLHLRVLVLKCKHLYHEKCLSNWLIHFKRTCPLCNEWFSIGETQPLLHSQHTDHFSIDLESQSDTPAAPMHSEVQSANSLLSINPAHSITPASHLSGSQLQTQSMMFTQNISLTQENAVTEVQTGSLASNYTVHTSDSMISHDSFKTTRTHNTDQNSFTSNYVTPQQSFDSGTEGTYLETSSKVTIKGPDSFMDAREE